MSFLRLKLILSLVSEHHSSSLALLAFIGLAALLQRFGHQTSPAGLMACAYTSASVPMEVLVKKNELVPIGIRLEFLNAPIDRALALLISQENPRKSARKLGGDIPQGEHVS